MTGRNRGVVVVVDRIEPGVEPPYWAYGRSPCIACEEWCWLGDQTYNLVLSEQAGPLCHECAAKYIPPGTPPVDHVEDHG